MQKTAIIDIDNTLWQFCDVFLVKLRQRNAAFPPVDLWTSGDFWQGYCSEAEFNDAINAIHFDQDNPAYLPYPESQVFLRTLKERGFRIMIASHRLAETRVPTERWLRRHELPYDELHLSFDKTVLFDRAAVVVDDAPQALRKAVAAGAMAAGLSFPWNRACAGNGIGLFPDLLAVLGYLSREGRA